MVKPVFAISPNLSYVPNKQVPVKPVPKKDLGFHAILVKAMNASK